MQSYHQPFVVIEDYNPAKSTQVTIENSALIIEDFSLIPNIDEVISVSPHPLKHRPYDRYEILPGKPKPTFHDVIKIKKIYSKHNSLYFFKKNIHVRSQSESDAKTFMYQLEAANCEMYHFIMPNLTPTARVLYDIYGEEVGISSKGIPGFKSTLEEPLTQEDLNIPALQHVSVSELEAFNQNIKTQNIDLDKLNDKTILFKKTEEPPTLSASLFNFFKVSNTKTITVKDLKNYRIIEGLAIDHATSHFFAEDDLHRGNMSKRGERIDFDMSSWQVLFDYKEIGIIDWAFRHPEGRFNLTGRDITKLPNFIDADPFYSSTKPARIIPEAILQYLATQFPISTNAFLIQDNLLYQQLEMNPIFIYHKFATYLKIAITPAEMYKNLIKLHVREDSADPKTHKNLIDILANYIEARLVALRNCLVDLPEFKSFFDDHGDKVMKNIVNEWQKHNNKYAKKAEKNSDYQNVMINLNDVEHNMSELKEKMEAEFAGFVYIAR